MAGPRPALLGRLMHRATQLLCAALLLPVAASAQPAQMWRTKALTSARYTEPTTRYPHGVLGDTIEHGALELRYDGVGQAYLIRLPEERVFEDTRPRIVDVDADGLPEAVVVESHRDRGARLAIYNAGGLVAATPYIGRRNRWLAPVAVADLDGDGVIELAYIDRPHLAKTLRVWRFKGGDLQPVGELAGLTNHRIGERDIAGGLRNCGQGPEMVVARADWQRLMAVRFDGDQLSARDIGLHEGRGSFARALACK
ncbi:MAG: VCBS repeat-containing protein [Sulfitobacter sp.]